MTGRFALAALLIVFGGSVASTAQQPASPDARAVAAMTDLLPPPVPLDDSAVAAARNVPGQAPLSNLRRGDFARAIWIDAADPALQSTEAIRRLVADCRTAGFNMIYALVRSGGTAAYLTELTPRAAGIPTGFDPLAVLLEEIRSGSSSPIEVHAWLRMASVGAPSGRDPRAHIAALHPDWLTASSAKVNPSPAWLDPAALDTRRHLANVAADLAKRYAVNGLVLEDAGYPGTLDTGYHAAAVERFRTETQAAQPPAPADLRWIEWRRTQSADLVRDIRQAVRSVSPQTPVTLLSTVDGPAPIDRATYNSGIASLKRPLDVWPVLAEMAAVDAIILATPQGTSTAAEASALEEWTAFALQTKGASRLIVGVQARPKDAKYTAAMMLDPILEPRADGVAVLPGTASPSGMQTAVFQQLFDPTLVEAHAQRLVTSTQASRTVRDAGMPLLSARTRLAIPGAPAPVAGSWLQAADPAAPGALPPLATPAPIGPDVTSLPPLPGPDTAPPALPALPAEQPGVPSAPPLPPADAPPLPPLPGADAPPLPPPPVADAPPSLPPVTAAPPADGPVPALPPLSSPLGQGFDPGASMPPLTPLEPAVASPPAMPLAPPPAPIFPLAGAPLDGGVYNYNTNFTGAPIAGPTRVMPTITPPTIGPPPPVVAGVEALPVGPRAAIAAPQFAIPDFSDPHSVFVPRVSPPVMRNYAPPPQRPTDAYPTVPEDQLDVILLNTGKEFVGRILEQGPVFRIQMPNGGIVKMDAGRIAAVRTSSPPLDVKPLELEPVAF